MYGIFDTKDNLWIGNSSGPVTFDELQLAQAAAQIVEVMLTSTDLGVRFQVREAPVASVRLHDELPVQFTAVEAMQRIEEP